MLSPSASRYREDPAFAAKRRLQARESYNRHRFERTRAAYLRLVGEGRIRNPRKLEMYQQKDAEDPDPQLLPASRGRECTEEG